MPLRLMVGGRVGVWRYLRSDGRGTKYVPGCLCTLLLQHRHASFLSTGHSSSWLHTDKHTKSWFQREVSKSWRENFMKSGYLVINKLIDVKALVAYQELCNNMLDGSIDTSDHRHDLGSFKRKENGGNENVCQIMWPSLYVKDLTKGPIHTRTREIAQYLLGPDMDFDFDMIIAKSPHTNTPVPWHQDEAYWNKAVDMPDKRAVSFWIALDDAKVENGCMWFVPGSHRLPLREHWPVAEGEHALMCKCTEKEGRPMPIAAGSCTLHHGRTLHYTRGNSTDTIRRAYIVNFRPKSMIEWERKHNFSHGKEGLKTSKI